MISAALLVRYRQVAPVRYWKPIQTGIEQDSDTETVVSLAGDGGRPPLDEGYRLPRPLSPHLSARDAGVSISLDTVAAIATAQPESDRFIVEGAGGVYVPLNDSQFMLDVMHLLALPVVVVSRSTLGTINHTLLTLAALRARQLTVAGVIMNGPLNDDNRRALSETLISLRDTMAQINKHSEDLGETIENMRMATAGIGKTLGNVDNTLGNVDHTLTTADHALTSVDTALGSLNKAINSADTTVTKLGRLSDDADKVVNGQGVAQMTQLVAQTRALVASLTRLTSDLEREPTRLIFGDQRQGYTPK